MSEYDFLSMMDDAALLMTEEDFERKQRSMVQGTGSNDYWNAGTGSNFFFAIPVFDPSTGKFTVVFEWFEHRKFLDNRSVVCLKETHGLDCPICDTRYQLFKDVFNNLPTRGKTPFIRENGLYTDMVAQGAVRLVQDSGEKGTKDFPRAEYEVGKVYATRYTPDPWNALMSLTRNADLNRRGPFWHPNRAKMIDYTIHPKEDTSNGRRKHVLGARHIDPEPLVCLPGTFDPDTQAINAALEEADQMVLWSYRYNLSKEAAREKMSEIKDALARRNGGDRNVTIPHVDASPFSEEFAARIDVQLEDMKEAAYKLVRKTYVSKYRRSTSDMRDRQSNAQPSRGHDMIGNQARGVRPTGDIDDATGKPMCHNKGAFDPQHDQCAKSCRFMMDCDKQRSTNDSPPPATPPHGGDDDYEPGLDVGGIGGGGSAPNTFSGDQRDAEPNYPSTPATYPQDPPTPETDRKLPPPPNEEDIPF